MTLQQPQQQTKQSNLYKLGVIYDAIARLLPLEGRDFNITITFDPGMHAHIIGLTGIGREFAKHVNNNLARELKEITDTTTRRAQPAQKEIQGGINAGRKNGQNNRFKCGNATNNGVTVSGGGNDAGVAEQYVL